MYMYVALFKHFETKKQHIFKWITTTKPILYPFYMHVVYKKQTNQYPKLISALPGSTLPASDEPSFPVQYDDTGMDKASE